MLFSEYAERCASFVTYSDSREDAYLIMGIQGEAGEVCGAYAKYERGDYDAEEMKRRVKDELGDVLWFTAMIARNAVVLPDMESYLERRKDHFQSPLVGLPPTRWMLSEVNRLVIRVAEEYDHIVLRRDRPEKIQRLFGVTEMIEALEDLIFKICMMHDLSDLQQYNIDKLTERYERKRLAAISEPS